jgi:hypothetical protein
MIGPCSIGRASFLVGTFGAASGPVPYHGARRLSPSKGGAVSADRSQPVRGDEDAG